MKRAERVDPWWGHPLLALTMVGVLAGTTLLMQKHAERLPEYLEPGSKIVRCVEWAMSCPVLPPGYAYWQDGWWNTAPLGCAGTPCSCPVIPSALVGFPCA
jgi:hypothetical protein